MVFHIRGNGRSCFRKDMNARELHSRSIFGRDLTLDEQYSHWTGRCDGKGQPICMFDIGKLDSKTMSAYYKSSAAMEIARSELKMPGIVLTEMLRAFTVYEDLKRFIMPLCTAVQDGRNADDAITKMTCVVAISGIGVRQVWNLRGYIQDLSKFFATSYLEVLDTVLVRNSPILFGDDTGESIFSNANPC